MKRKKRTPKTTPEQWARWEANQKRLEELIERLTARDPAVAEAARKIARGEAVGSGDGLSDERHASAVTEPHLAAGLLDETRRERVLPYRQARTRRPPRVDHLRIGPRPVREPLEQL